MFEHPLRIVRPSSRATNDLLPGRLEQFKAAGLHVLFDELPSHSDWPFHAAHPADRARALEQGLQETASKVILCARGGYGASELLPLMDWHSLKNVNPKLLVGFSDVSALHSAIYTKLGWPGLHAPMPGNSFVDRRVPE